jgi:hypothetical protein
MGWADFYLLHTSSGFCPRGSKWPSLRVTSKCIRDWGEQTEYWALHWWGENCEDLVALPTGLSVYRFCPAVYLPVEHGGGVRERCCDYQVIQRIWMQGSHLPSSQHTQPEAGPCRWNTKSATCLVLCFHLSLKQWVGHAPGHPCSLLLKVLFWNISDPLLLFSHLSWTSPTHTPRAMSVPCFRA